MLSPTHTYEVTSEMIYGRKLGLPPWAWLFLWHFALTALVFMCVRTLYTRQRPDWDIFIFLFCLSSYFAWSEGTKRDWVTLGTNYVSVGNKWVTRSEIVAVKEVRPIVPMFPRNGIRVVTLSKPWSWFEDSPFIPAVTPRYEEIRAELLNWASENRARQNSRS
jgi:hypothetical protein